jgi:hypothetical protein
MVTTKEHRPKFAMSLSAGLRKIVDRGGFFSLWRGNATSVLHRFPYSAINFYVYEHTLDALSVAASTAAAAAAKPRHEMTETQGQLVRRITRVIMSEEIEEEDRERKV